MVMNNEVNSNAQDSAGDDFNHVLAYAPEVGIPRVSPTKEGYWVLRFEPDLTYLDGGLVENPDRFRHGVHLRITRVETLNYRTKVDFDCFYLDEQDRPSPLFVRQDWHIGGAGVLNSLARDLAHAVPFFRPEATPEFFDALASAIQQAILVLDHQLRDDNKEVRSYLELEIDQETDRVSRYLAPGRVSIMFGVGGSGKSYFALYEAARLASLGKTVAWVDLEEGEEEWEKRLFGIMGENDIQVAGDNLLYVSSNTLLSENLGLAYKLRQAQVDYLFVDSAMQAVDSAKDEDSVGRLFRWVKSIGAGCLIIAHVPHADKDRKEPYGSIRWFNECREVYRVDAQDLDDQTGFTMTITDTKLKREPQRAIRMVFSEPYQLRISGGDPADVEASSKHLAVPQRIIQLLRGGAMPRKEIYQALKDGDDKLSGRSLPATISRMIHRGQLVETEKGIGLLTH